MTRQINCGNCQMHFQDNDFQDCNIADQTRSRSALYVLCKVTPNNILLYFVSRIVINVLDSSHWFEHIQGDTINLRENKYYIVPGKSIAW